MHGYGPSPQQPIAPRPSPATITAIRVILVVLTVLSCGLLGWAPMLRLAIVTRKGRDWFLLAVVAVSNIALFAFILATPDDPDDMTDAQALILAAWMLGALAAVITYYLSAEIRHYSSLGASPPYAAYGFPPVPYQQQHSVPQHPAQPQAQHRHRPPTAHPPQSPSQPRPSQGQHPNPYAAPAAPTTPTPAPRRLDQVRAELDELSDYLRKESQGNPAGQGSRGNPGSQENRGSGEHGGRGEGEGR
ncbi:hypothetical protein [Streptomyces californicus]|uniref:hypothetical protein n=1 Tax=Streptomyces californicus TaxID=67351 RepID=UPI0035DE5DF9